MILVDNFFLMSYDKIIGNGMETDMTDPRIIDNDRGEITATVDGKEIRGWSYIDDTERRTKMRMAHEFAEGWFLAKQRSGWNVIETAPKNGTAILLCNGEWMTVGHWHRSTGQWATNGPEYSPYPADEQPTHWMPQPAPPPKDPVDN